MSDIIAEFIFPENPDLTADFQLGGNATGTTDYKQLENKPSINKVELVGNKTLDELGIQPEGDYALTSDIPDLTDYVKNTDYATSSNGGVIRTSATYNGLVSATTGYLYTATKTLDQYETMPTSAFVGKGTLENIKDDYVKRGVTQNQTELTEAEKASAKNWLGFATPTEIMQAIASIPQFKLSIVDALPETGEKMTLYLVSKGTESPDVYDEYIWIEETSTFEFLGTTAVDLTDYVKKTDYATDGNIGVVKGSGVTGLYCNSSGNLICSTASLSAYENKPVSYTIGKGTLENIKDDYVKRGLTENTIEFTDEEKTSARTLIGAVGSTDYATGTVAGVVRSGSYYGTQTIGGFLAGNPRTLEQYKEAINQIFIAKGTLENIKDDYIKRGLTENTIELTDAEKTSARTWLGTANDSAVVHLAGDETITGIKTFTLPDNIKFTASKTTGYTPSMTNAQTGLTPATNVPWSRNGWHDHFAFGQSFTVYSKEVTTDGESWVADDRDISYLFAQKEYGESAVSAPNAGEMGFRFVLQSANIAYSNIQWIEVGFAYTTAHTVRLLVEVSSNGTEWTEVHNSTTGASATNKYLYVGNLSASNTYLRISVIKLYTSSLDAPTRMIYVKGWTTRKGNQGRGIEFEFPYYWDNIPNLMPVKHNVSNLGSTNRRWNNVYANKIVIGNVELDGEKLQRLLALLT